MARGQVGACSPESAPSRALPGLALQLQIMGSDMGGSGMGSNLRINPVRLARLAGASLIIVIAGLQFAAAAEWRFCIAPANQERKIYMTAPYLTGTAMETLESGFHQALDRSGRRHDSVQCPTGANEQAVRAMRQHADEFNRQMGNEVIPIDWKPAGAATIGH
jgi:hypothetical protein